MAEKAKSNLVQILKKNIIRKALKEDIYAQESTENWLKFFDRQCVSKNFGNFVNWWGKCAADFPLDIVRKSLEQN